MCLRNLSSSAANVSPAAPAGWIGIEMPTQVRSNVVVSFANVPNQNFGLAQAATLGGTVFNDNRTGGGTADDG